METRRDSNRDSPARPPAALRDPFLAARSAAPRLRASWRRSEQYGVPHDEVLPVFTGSVDTGSLLFDCASQVLTGLQSAIANEPVSLMVADRDGLVLGRLCTDSAMLRSLDHVHLAPGFSYAERNAGTNGLGLSLADRAPTLVRAGDHYCSELRNYTCAAAPVLDPSGDLAGSINLTTWSDSSSDLLLGLAQAAAGATSALMLARSAGRTMRPAPRGEVVHVVGGPLAPEFGDPCVSGAWHSAVASAASAAAAGQVAAVVGEPGAGKSALAALTRRRLSARQRILHARAPEAGDVPAWLELWTPELWSADVCVIVSGVHSLPAWAAGELAEVLGSARRDAAGAQPFVFTAPDFAGIPYQLAVLVDAVVEVPPLRHRPEDVLPLAHSFARQERRRELAFSSRAVRALTGCSWPENVRQLRRVVRDAAARADVVDVAHLAPEVLDGSARSLTRLERLERDEIVRCLTAPGTTMARAAEELGIGRATLYRKIAHYDITLAWRSAEPPG